MEEKPVTEYAQENDVEVWMSIMGALEETRTQSGSTTAEA